MAREQRRSAASGPPPYVPGMDAAGVLEEVGDGVETDLRVGDHVMAIVVPTGSHGGYSEQIVVPAASVARVPVGATDVEASTLPMNGLTAQLALDVLALEAGRSLAVTGAAGAFGGYMVQLAKASGLTVIADASEDDEELVGRLGADVVLRRGSDFPARVRQRFPAGVDAAADGALLNGLLTPAIRDGGTVVTVRGYREDGERGVAFRPIAVRDYARGPRQAGPAGQARRRGKGFVTRRRDCPQRARGRGTPAPRSGRRPGPPGDPALRPFLPSTHESRADRSGRAGRSPGGVWPGWRLSAPRCLAVIRPGWRDLSLWR